MINLAGNQNCDAVIREELMVCDIPLVYGARSGNEVPASITGKLGEFTFYRAWYYWVASGPMPLSVATEMYETNPDWRKTVRAAGHAGCPHPKDWAKYYAEDGREILTRKDEADLIGFLDSESEQLKEIGRNALEEYVFADDPAAVAHTSVITEFHIDSQLGLKLFADTVRKL